MNVTVQFPVRITNEDSGFAYVDHDAVSASGYYRSEAEAKRKLRKLVTSEVEDALQARHNSRSRAIASRKGDVFIACFRNGGWCYYIVSGGRNHACSVHAFDDLDAATAAARRHIEQCFDGVAWECAF